jgi:hypothetical protein
VGEVVEELRHLHPRRPGRDRLEDAPDVVGVPPTEINRAISRKKLFEANSQKHTYQGEAL